MRSRANSGADALGEHKILSRDPINIGMEKVFEGNEIKYCERNEQVQLKKLLSTCVGVFVQPGR